CSASAQTRIAARLSSAPGSTGTTMPMMPTRIATPTRNSENEFTAPLWHPGSEDAGTAGEHVVRVVTALGGCQSAEGGSVVGAPLVRRQLHRRIRVQRATRGAIQLEDRPAAGQRRGDGGRV